MLLLKSKIIRVLAAFCLVFSMAALTFADTIRLKDGSIIKGKIVSFVGGKFTVVIGSGTRTRQLDFSADEVESISFDTDGNGVGSFSRNSAPATDAVNTAASNKEVSLPQTSATTQQPSRVITAAPPVSSSSTDNQTTANSSNVSSSGAKPEPIKVNVKVSADNSSNGWTNSGWVVQKGQKIRIIGSGRISLGSGRFATPGGVASLPDAGKLMPNQATGALIAVIGDDNNDFIFVGDSTEFTATRDGALFLGVNEANLNDNSGAFDVRVEIDPSK